MLPSRPSSSSVYFILLNYYLPIASSCVLRIRYLSGLIISTTLPARFYLPSPSIDSCQLGITSFRESKFLHQLPPPPPPPPPPTSGCMVVNENRGMLKPLTSSRSQYLLGHISILHCLLTNSSFLTCFDGSTCLLSSITRPEPEFCIAFHGRFQSLSLLYICPYVSSKMN